MLIQPERFIIKDADGNIDIMQSFKAMVADTEDLPLAGAEDYLRDIPVGALKDETQAAVLLRSAADIVQRSMDDIVIQQRLNDLTNAVNALLSTVPLSGSMQGKGGGGKPVNDPQKTVENKPDNIYEFVFLHGQEKAFQIEKSKPGRV